MTKPLPAAGAHGGDGPRIARALGIPPTDLMDLSQTLNPFAPDVTRLLARHLDAVRHYPDEGAATTLLAETMGVDPARLVLTNGGSEAIALVAGELGGRVAAEPEFGLHPRGSDGPVWRSDPQSPSGFLAGPDVEATVWDEAFYPMATGCWTAARPGVTVGSLTKLFACPGLRLGFVLADDVVALVRRRPQWSVGSLALAVLPELLAAADLPAWQVAIADTRSALSSALVERGYEVEAHDAPWVLVRAPGLRERLAPHGVVVRDCTSFGLPEHVRIAVPDEDGLARLLTAIDRQAGSDAGR
jgi:histidinol-phosphate/aromatic aminotransferase/cobyric acid decarboxylase-like protein